MGFFLWGVEVMKGLWEKRCAKMKKRESESESGDKQLRGMKEKLGSEFEIPPRRSEKEKTNQVNLFLPII